MYKLFKTTCVVILLPLMATAVLFAEGFRAQVHLNASANIEAMMDAAMDSWQDEGLENTLRAHYIRLNEDNRLSGEISAIQNETGEVVGIESLEVSLVQASEVISRTTTDDTGFFVTDEVEPGTYTLCVSGDDGFLAYGIQVIERDDVEADSLPVPLPGGDDEGASVTRRRLQLASFSGANAIQEDGEVKITAAVIPPEFTALRRIMQDYVPADVGVGMGTSVGSQINVKDSVVAGGFQITLSADGTLTGRVAPLTSEDEEPIRLQEMNAFLLLDDEIYARASVDEDGNFEFNDVEPNIYGFAAAGKDGFAALSFQAVAAEDLESSANPDSPFRNAAATVNRKVADDLKVAICPTEDTPFLRARINALSGGGEQFAFEDIPRLRSRMPGTGTGAGGPFGGPPGGSYTPYGGGGGSGPGYTGGIGEWQGLIDGVLAAWLLSEAFNNNNNNQVPIQETIQEPLQPVSPFAFEPANVPQTGNDIN